MSSKCMVRDELDEALGSGKFVGNIFHEHSYAERLGEGAQMLDAGHGGFEFLFVEGFVGIADVLDEKAERDVLGDFEGAFDFVHGIDASGAVGGGDVDGRRTGASPLVVGVQRRVDGIEWNAGGAEPVGNFADMLLAIGVIEVLAGGEDFDRLGSPLDQLVKQARMESFLYIDVCRYSPQHQ